jgi:hypothetical protein
VLFTPLAVYEPFVSTETVVLACLIRAATATHQFVLAKHFEFGKAYMQMGLLQRLAVVMAAPCTYCKRLLTGSEFTQLWIENQNCCC